MEKKSVTLTKTKLRGKTEGESGNPGIKDYITINLLLGNPQLIGFQSKSTTLITGYIFPLPESKGRYTSMSFFRR